MAGSPSSADGANGADRGRGYSLWVEAWRGDRVESRHRVFCAALPSPAAPGYECDSRALPRTSMRSTAKPFQLLPLLAAGGAERFGLDDTDLALMAASHDGTEAHAARVERILLRLGLGPEHLQCGLHRPYFLENLPADAPVRSRLYGPLHHNCSGSHAGLLALGLLHDVPPERYLDAQGRGNMLVTRLVQALSGSEPIVLEDNCGAPCYDLPLPAIAECYRLLALPEAVHTLDPARRRLLGQVAPLPALVAGLERVGRAMAAYPEWVSGEFTGSTLLMRRLGGTLVLKHGAEGVLCAAWRDRAASLALKVADGQSRAALPALAELMRAFRWLDDAALSSLYAVREPVLHGDRGQAVGKLQVRSGEP